MTDRDHIKGALVFAAAIALLGVCVHLCKCSPVNVQVQQCSNVVKDSSGFTFTGCKAKGSDQPVDGRGELRVDLPNDATKERPEGGQSDAAGHPPGNLLTLLN